MKAILDLNPWTVGQLGSAGLEERRFCRRDNVRRRLGEAARPIIQAL
jgi:hypothetical protein